MKYFLDTEFLEGRQRYRKSFIDALFSTKKFTEPTIDLISIGIVSEDGRQYYAVSKDFNLNEAWNRYQLEGFDKQKNLLSKPRKVYWIRDNVLLPIYKEFISGDLRNHLDFSYSTMKWILKTYGKSNSQIAEEVKSFCEGYTNKCMGRTLGFKESNLPSIEKEYGELVYETRSNPEFYGYYSDYDWVAFCWLFGKMNDLPKTFPMYCKDLKQMLDEKVTNYNKVVSFYEPTRKMSLNAFWDMEFVDGFSYRKVNLSNCTLDYKLNIIKNHHSEYPKQKNEHNALADAKWNYELFKFIEKL